MTQSGKLAIYVGSPEEDPSGTYVYLELEVSGLREITLEDTQKLDDLTSEEVLQQLEEIFNSASLVRKGLNLPVHISSEQFSEMCVELDCNESTTKNIQNLIREFRKGTKGELLDE